MAAVWPQILPDILFVDKAQLTQGTCDLGHREIHTRYHNATLNRVFHLTWYEVLGSDLIGPHVIKGRLTAPYCIKLMENVLDLPLCLKHVPLATWEQIRLRLDRAPLHVKWEVIESVNKIQEGIWIGRSGQVSWPTSSPPLNQLDFWWSLHEDEGVSQWKTKKKASVGRGHKWSHSCYERQTAVHVVAISNWLQDWQLGAVQWWAFQMCCNNL